MQHAARVRERHGIADAQKQAEAIRRRRNIGDKFIEAPAFDKFHGVENTAIRERAHVVNGNDAGMLELREDAGFAHQAFAERAVGSSE